MINLIICILGLVLGIYIAVYEYKMDKKHLKIKWYIIITRYIGWFLFGFFLCETFKWINGITTLIF